MFTGPSLTAAELTSLDPVVPANELWIEKDTGYVKRGNGGSAWTSLSYWNPAGPTQNYLAGFGPSLQGSAGEYWSMPVVHTTLVTVAGTMYTQAVYVPQSVVIDRIGAEVTTGAASSTVTLGVYRDDGSGNPGVLLFDAGTIDGNSATAQEITVSKKITGPGLYHLAALVAGGTPTVRAASTAAASWVGRQSSLANATGTSALRLGRTQGSIVGTSLPNPAVTTGPNNAPLIAVRFA